MHIKAFIGLALLGAIAAGLLLPTGHEAKAERQSKIPTLELSSR